MSFPVASNYGTEARPYDDLFEDLIDYLQDVRGPNRQQSMLIIAPQSALGAPGASDRDYMRYYSASKSIRVQQDTAAGQVLTLEQANNRCASQNDCPSGWNCFSPGASNSACRKSFGATGGALLAALEEARDVLTSDGAKGPIHMYAFVSGVPDARGVVADNLEDLLAAARATRDAAEREEEEEFDVDPAVAAMQRTLASAPAGSQYGVYVLPLYPGDASGLADRSTDEEECSFIRLDDDGTARFVELQVRPSVCACLRLVGDTSNYGGFYFSSRGGDRAGEYRGWYIKRYAADSPLLALSSGDGRDDSAQSVLEQCPPAAGCPKSDGWVPACGMPLRLGQCMNEYVGPTALRDFIVDAVRFFEPKQRVGVLLYPGTCGSPTFDPETQFIDDAAAVVFDQLSIQYRTAQQERARGGQPQENNQRPGDARSGAGTDGTLVQDKTDEDAQNDTSAASGLSAGAIAGIVIGALVLLIIIAVVIAVAVRKRDQEKEQRGQPQGTSAYYQSFRTNP